MLTVAFSASTLLTMASIEHEMLSPVSGGTPSWDNRSSGIVAVYPPFGLATTPMIAAIILSKRHPYYDSNGLGSRISRLAL